MSARILHGDCLALMREMSSDSFDAIVTDTPYGMSDPPDIVEVLRHWLAGERYVHGKAGFMGAEWDSFVPGPRVWRETLRVAKPGAHALVFASTRTVDLMGIACRLGGWEVRDTLHWCHWQGQPHGLDVSQAIDAVGGCVSSNADVGDAVRAARASAGMSLREVGKAALEATDGRFGAWYHRGGHMFYETGRSVPSLDEWTALCSVLPIDRTVADVHAAAIREVVGEGYRVRRAGGTTPNAGVSTGAYDLTTAATEDAAKWEGWNTALKPAVEPILLLRKPLSESTIARNVLRWGTGALNIDASRIPNGSSIWPGPLRSAEEINATSNPNTRGKPRTGDGAAAFMGKTPYSAGPAAHPLGRYPGNLLHFKKPSRREKEAGCEALPIMLKPDIRNGHPTVKSIALMSYLCTLATPTGGDILDMFGGSGTTGIAAKLRGFNVTLCELNEAFVDIARARIKHAAPGQEVEGGTDPEPVKGHQVVMF